MEVGVAVVDDELDLDDGEEAVGVVGAGVEADAVTRHGDGAGGGEGAEPAVGVGDAGAELAPAVAVGERARGAELLPRPVRPRLFEARARIAPVTPGASSRSIDSLLADAAGGSRLSPDDALRLYADAPALDKKLKHDIEVVVDRIVVRPDMAARRSGVSAAHWRATRGPFASRAAPCVR